MAQEVALSGDEDGSVKLSTDGISVGVDGRDQPSGPEIRSANWQLPEVAQ